MQAENTYETVDTSIDDGDLNFRGHGLVLTLLCITLEYCSCICRSSRTQELGETGATGEEETGRGVEIRTELCESGDFTVLSKVKFEGTGKLLHDLATMR